MTSSRSPVAPHVPRVLVAEDDPTARRSLERGLGRLGFVVDAVDDGCQAEERLSLLPYDVVVTDLAMPHADGFAVLEGVRRTQPETPVIILTASGSFGDCVRAMRAGAYDFVGKPFDLDVLQSRVMAAIASRGTGVAIVGEECSGSVASQLEHPLGHSIDQVAGSDATVLITGETGVGKEVVAHAIHERSLRARKPFVVVNCAAMPAGLIESELFGHVAGAFTDATAARPGLLQTADGGTLFLDEVGELPVALQTRLLRVLQDRMVSPVGGSTTAAIDVRFIAATNRDLSAMVKAGTFREDLYFRLNVVPLEVPPLRARGAEIATLAIHFLTEAATRKGVALSISDAAMALLHLYDWPGNVRELEHLMERMAVLDTDGLIDLDDLPAHLRAGAAGEALKAPEVFSKDEEGLDLTAAVAKFERALIDNVLRRTRGNRSRAAALLGIGRTTLLDKLKRRP